MKIQVLGGHGGLAPGFSTTSFLIDDHLLIDAGSVASTLSIAAQTQITNILISHSHLDHIKDLAFLCDNCFGQKSEPFHVFTHATVKKIIMDHLFNDVIWPDFTNLPTSDQPTISFHALEPEQLRIIGDYQVTPVKVQHQNDAMGFVIEREGVAVLFTLDTGPTDRIWEIGKQFKNLKAIFTEVSFPNSLQKVAILSDHHTPQSMGEEIKKMPLSVPVILTHVKPNFKDIIFKEVADLQESRIQILEQDGAIFSF